MSGDQGEDWSGRNLDDRYAILERVGDGGMGVVYRARQLSVERIVAIKVLHAHVARDPQWLERFYNEARACSQLQHPNTVRMFDFGQTSEGNFYMVMEFLEGRSLHDVITTDAPMAVDRVLKILIQCCASLAEAHARGIIHRDIKAENVILIDLPDASDHVKLLDFSVAKVLQEHAPRTAAGLIFGTPQYMSPEQANGEPLDPRADLYSLGILGYEMLTGELPFDSENPMVVLHMVKSQALPALPRSIPMRVAQLLSRCLEKARDKRPGSASEMMTELADVRAQLHQPRAVIPHTPAQQQTLQDGGSMPSPALGAAPPIEVIARSAARVNRTILGSPPPRAASHGDATLLEEEPPQAVRDLNARQDPPVAPAPAQPLPGAVVSPFHRPLADGEEPRQTQLLPDDEKPAVSTAPAPMRQASQALFWLACVVAAIAVAIGSYLAVVAMRS